MISEKHRTRNQTITLRVTPSERELFLRGEKKHDADGFSRQCRAL